MRPCSRSNSRHRLIFHFPHRREMIHSIHNVPSYLLFPAYTRDDTATCWWSRHWDDFHFPHTREMRQQAFRFLAAQGFQVIKVRISKKRNNRYTKPAKILNRKFCLLGVRTYIFWNGKEKQADFSIICPSKITIST